MPQAAVAQANMPGQQPTMGGMLAEGMAWGTGDALARSAFGGGYGYHSSGGGAADTGGSAVDAADTVRTEPPFATPRYHHAHAISPNNQKDGAPVDSGAVGPDPTVMNSTKTNEWGDVVDSNTNEWGDQVCESYGGPQSPSTPHV